jgi:hypothetical protein
MGIDIDTDKLRADLLDVGADGLTELLEAVRDGQVTPDEARALVVETLAEAIDAAVPTGPLDAYDDGVILSTVGRAYDFVASFLRRDPAKLRARADEAEAAGKVDRAARLRAAADRIEAAAAPPTA